MTQKTSFKEELVRQLAEILNDTNLTEIEYELDNCRIRVAREVQQIMTTPHINTPVTQAPAQTPAPQIITQATNDLADHPGVLKAPMVGTAYMAPSPGADNFVKVGDSVESGQTLLIIEAMKVMNQIKATTSGIVKEILVRDADPIEFDQPLIIIE